MKKFTFLFVLGSMVVARTNAQKAWIPQFRFYKTIVNGGIPDAVQYMDKKDSLAFYGVFTSVDMMSSDGKTVAQTVPNLNNTIKKNGNSWVNAGNILASPGYPYSQAVFHNKIYGEDYIAIVPPPYIVKRNVSSNNYEEIPGLVLDGWVRLICEWGGQNVLIGGNFSTVNGQNIPGLVIWNKTTGQLTPITGVIGFRDFFYSEVDSTLLILVAGKVMAAQKGSTSFTQIGSELPCHFGLRISARNKDSIYVVVGQFGPERYEVQRLVNGSWIKLFEMHPTVYSSNYFTLRSIEGFFLKEDKVYVAGWFDSVNGQSRNGAISYNETTNVNSNLSPMPSDVYSPNLISGLWEFDNQFYLATQAGSLNQYQITYILRDTTRPVTPTIEGLTGTKSVSSLTDSGMAAPNTSVDYYVNGIKANTVISDGVGKWKAIFMVPGDGVYQRYVKSRNADGVESLPSQTIQVVVDATKPAQLTPLYPKTDTVINPYQVVTFTVSGAEKNSKVLFHIIAIGNNHFEYRDITVVIPAGIVTYQRTFDQAATYQWEAIPIDSAGNEGVPTMARHFTVSAITAVDDPIVNRDSAIIVYPNPIRTNSLVTIQNVTKLLGIFTLDGKRLPLPQQSFNGRVVTFYAPAITAGQYVALCQTKNKKQVVLKLLIMH